MFSCTKTCGRLKTMTTWRNVTCWLVPMMLIFCDKELVQNQDQTYPWIPRPYPLNYHPLRAYKSEVFTFNLNLPSKYQSAKYSKQFLVILVFSHVFAQLNVSTIKAWNLKKRESRRQSLTWLQCKCQASVPKKRWSVGTELRAVSLIS